MQFLQVSRPPYVASAPTRSQILAAISGQRVILLALAYPEAKRGMHSQLKISMRSIAVANRDHRRLGAR
jgi:hypothetical protein